MHAYPHLVYLQPVSVPFMYNNIQYDSFTTSSYHAHWCYIDGTSSNWIECESKSETTGGCMPET